MIYFTPHVYRYRVKFKNGNASLNLLRSITWFWYFVKLWFQSTPVGSIQTGHEIVVSPNRVHQPFKVNNTKYIFLNVI